MSLPKLAILHKFNSLEYVSTKAQNILKSTVSPSTILFSNSQVISIHRSKEEIAEYSLGFMVHDKQVRPLCGSITKDEEQLFGYEVSVYRK